MPPFHEECFPCQGTELAKVGHFWYSSHVKKEIFQYRLLWVESKGCLSQGSLAMIKDAYVTFCILYQFHMWRMSTYLHAVKTLEKNYVGDLLERGMSKRAFSYFSYSCFLTWKISTQLPEWVSWVAASRSIKFELIGYSPVCLCSFQNWGPSHPLAWKAKLSALCFILSQREKETIFTVLRTETFAVRE